MKPLRKMLDVIPDHMALHPTEIANRLSFMFNGKLLPLLFVWKAEHHVRIVPAQNGGVTYVNEKDELLLGRPA